MLNDGHACRSRGRRRWRDHSACNWRHSIDVGNSDKRHRMIESGTDDRWRHAGMTDASRIPTLLIALVFMMTRSIAAFRHCRYRSAGSGRRTQRRCAKNKRDCKETDCQQLHAMRLLRRNGQRMNRRIVPAGPKTNPPMANASSHQVLIFS